MLWNLKQTGFFWVWNPCIVVWSWFENEFVQNGWIMVWSPGKMSNFLNSLGPCCPRDFTSLLNSLCPCPRDFTTFLTISAQLGCPSTNH
jgi:hypothetical protein